MHRSNPEKRIQNAIMSWLKFNRFLAWHIPNRGYYNAVTKRYNITDGWAVPGIPDLEIVLPKGVTVRIEVKSHKGVLSTAQKVMIEKLNELGHKTFVARSVAEVEDFFRGNGWIK